jgi:hypothetical protein
VEAGGRAFVSKREVESFQPVRKGWPKGKKRKMPSGEFTMKPRAGARPLGKAAKSPRPPRHTDETLQTGSVIHWSERTGHHVPVTCGECGKRRTVRVQGSWNREPYTGYCPECAHVICRGKRTGDERHATGAIIHWSEREEGNCDRVYFDCGECRVRDTVSVNSLEAGTWRGVCASCKQRRGAYNKRLADETLQTGSVVQWSQREGNSVPVSCGLCGLVHKMHKGTTDDPGFTGYCRTHTRHEIALLASVGQKKGVAEKRKRGRQLGDTLINYDEFIANLKTCLLEELSAVKQLTSAVKQKAVLIRYHHRCPGDRIAATTLKARLVSAGYGMEWPQFVEVIAREGSAG